MEPVTRKEMFLAKAGGQSVATPEPITREEIFLQRIAENGGSGGGSGGVTSWNDLKDNPIMVVSVVSINEDETFTVDKNYAEVSDALSGNKIVLMSLMGVPLIATGITIEKNDNTWFAEFAMLTDPNMKVLLDENGIVTFVESE